MDLRYAGVLSLLLPVCATAQLTGSYTIGGSAPDYASITDAVNDLLSSGASGNVTFNIRPGTYTGQYALTAIPGSPGSITFQSETNNATDVVLEFDATFPLDNHILKIDGTDNLVLNDLTFHPLNFDRARAIHFFNDANLLQLIDCVFIGSQNTSGSGYMDRILVQNDQVDIGTTANPDDFIVDGCTFRYGNTAMELRFSGLGGVRSQGLIITDNTFSDQSGTGVMITSAVGQFGDNTMTTEVGNGFVGLRTSYFDGGSQIRRNVLRLKSATGGTEGMEIGNTQFTTGNMISNNMITVDGPGECWGLAVYNLWDMKIVNNSIAIVGGSATSKAFYHLGNFADGQDTRTSDNIFSNYAGGHALECNVAGNLGTTEDHNDLWTTGAVLALVDGTDYLTIAGYQAGTGQGAGDVKIDPAFPFLPDLHLNSCALDGLGQHSLVVYTDIDGDVRANPACDMGADEFTFSGSASISLTVLSTDLPLTISAGNGSGYVWNTGATTQGITVPAGGIYGCTFTDANGCAYTAYWTITVDFSTEVVEVVDDGMVLYPNPASTEFSIQGDRSAWSDVLLIDAGGRTVRAWRPDTRFDLGTIEPGVYTVRVRNHDGSGWSAPLVVR